MILHIAVFNFSLGLQLRKRVERDLICLQETDTESTSSSSSDSEDDSEYNCSTGSRSRKKKKDETGCQNSKQEKARDDQCHEKPERQLVKRNQLSSKGAEKNGPKSNNAPEELTKNRRERTFKVNKRRCIYKRST